MDLGIDISTLCTFPKIPSIDDARLVASEVSKQVSLYIRHFCESSSVHDNAHQSIRQMAGMSAICKEFQSKDEVLLGNTNTNPSTHPVLVRLNQKIACLCKKTEHNS
jgi:hypothetical protein